MEIEIKKHKLEEKFVIDVKHGRVQYKDTFHINNVMAYMHDWFCDNGWGDRSDPKFPEVFYHHRFNQVGGEEIRYYWRLSKMPAQTPNSGYSELYKYEIDVDVRAVAIMPTEVMKRGIKFKAFTGDIEIKFWSRLMIDDPKEKKNQWKNHWILKHFLDMYINRFNSKEVAWHYAFTRREMNRFQEALKAYFKFPQYLPEKEGEFDFHFTKDFD